MEFKELIWYVVLRHKKIHWTYFCSNIKWIHFQEKKWDFWEIWNIETWEIMSRANKFDILTQEQAIKEMKEVNNNALEQLKHIAEDEGIIF